jgi:arginine decarboxylase
MERIEKWSVEKSNELYRIDSWGAGFFKINESGNVSVQPDPQGPAVDLHEIVQDLARRGVQLPYLIRFDGIIRQRINSIYEAFEDAIKDCDYRSSYILTYPIKVNQQRHVVESVKSAGDGRMVGLEIGSKPELIAVLSVHNTQNGLLLCNGYKDYQLIELALMSKKLGLRPIIIIEQFYELETILNVSESLKIVPEIGLRMNPVNKGTGHWSGSAGENAKFGLALYELLEAVQQLKARGMEHCVKLLHYHIGSQVTSINAIKKAIKEASRVFVEIAKLCPEMEFLDVGGGLGVDYDGSKTNFESSMNYSTAQYARDIVWEIKTACDEAGVRHPTIISESGRAVAAHHSAVITEVMDVAEVSVPPRLLEAPPSDNERLQELVGLYRELNLKNCHESFNDAVALRDEFLQSFIQGTMSLAERAYGERVIRFLFTRIKGLKGQMKKPPEDLEALDEMLKDMYFCNFSVFQSILDSWAIEQLFPVMPIHRLQEQPDRRGVIADLTCDSDGIIDRFIDEQGVQTYLPLHPFSNDKPYYLGVFLVGAYQEGMGNLHNSFGDTNVVHVEVDKDGQPHVTSIIEGDTIREVLSYIQYPAEDLVAGINASIERAIKNGTINPQECAYFMQRYKESLGGYTYLLWESPR